MSFYFGSKEYNSVNIIFLQTESLAELELQRFQKEHQLKLESTKRSSQSGGVTKLKQFLKPTGYKPIVILWGLFFFQQFSGIYITLFYSVTLFEVSKSIPTIINNTNKGFFDVTV